MNVTDCSVENILVFLLSFVKLLQLSWGGKLTLLCLYSGFYKRILGNYEKNVTGRRARLLGLGGWDGGGDL